MNSLPGFPIALFTLSLEKIAHILDGALASGPTPGATEGIQVNEPGTLRQNLRDLRVAEATVQLENLAREAGIDPSTWADVPLAQCEGEIVSAFRELKSTYEKLRSDLIGATGRIAILQTVLKQAPDEFRYPKNVLTLEKLHGRPSFIEDALENARGDDVDRLRSEFDTPARLGNFKPLMSNARELLEEPRGSLTHLLGQVLSIENAVAEYRKRLIEGPDLLRSQRAIEALAKATSTTAPKPLVLKDIEDAGALTAAETLVKARVQENSIVGGKPLVGAGVSFDRWSAIVTALDAGRDPDLEAQEADELVKRGLVQRTYRLGARS